ncbi:MAG: hypothetical protein WBF17_20685 [Phycisphaerae bacterium]
MVAVLSPATGAATGTLQTTSIDEYGTFPDQRRSLFTPGDALRNLGRGFQGTERTAKPPPRKRYTQADLRRP